MSPASSGRPSVNQRLRSAGPTRYAFPSRREGEFERERVRQRAALWSVAKAVARLGAAVADGAGRPTTTGTVPTCQAASTTSRSRVARPAGPVPRTTRARCVAPSARRVLRQLQFGHDERRGSSEIRALQGDSGGGVPADGRPSVLFVTTGRHSEGSSRGVTRPGTMGPLRMNKKRAWRADACCDA